QEGGVTVKQSNRPLRGHKLNHGSDWGDGEPTLYFAFNHVDGINTDTESAMQTDLITWFDDESESYYGVPVVEDGPVPDEFFAPEQQFSFNPPSDDYWDAESVPGKVRAGAGHNRGINPDGSPFYGHDDNDAEYIQRAATDTTEETYRPTGAWDDSTFPGTAMYEDSDGDHMPDWFEDGFDFLDKNDPSDMLATHVDWDFTALGQQHGYEVVNEAGYTNLEICAEFYAGGFETMIEGNNNLSLGD
ncbi:MAG: hypothetical protein AAFU79_14775, partial [Myxococcota bacterium]